jgi:hypothetical protein
MDTRVLPHEKSGRGVTLITSAHLVPRLRMSGAVPLFLLSSWHAQGQLYLYILYFIGIVDIVIVVYFYIHQTF